MKKIIRLEPITKSNWKTCVTLQLSKNQQVFLPDNLYSIAESQFYPDAHPMAIYSHDVMVGFVLYGRDEVSHHWKIFRLMIDYTHQRNGYATQALRDIISIISEKLDSDVLLIRYHNQNEVARRLYEKFGFQEISVDADNVMTARLNLEKS